jgi:hypothetical protein
MKSVILFVVLLLTQQSIRPGVGTIAGRIGIADGSPASGIRVAAVLEGTAQVFVAFGQTDSEGRYQLSDVPRGTYFVAAGFIDSLGFFPGVKTVQEARSVAVAAGGSVANIDFVIANSSYGVRIRGRVRNLPRVPSGVVRASLHNSNGPDLTPFEVEVAADGSFEFQKVPRGNYGVSLNPVALASPFWLTVGDSDVDNVEFTIGTVVVGRVIVDDGSLLPLRASAIAAGRPDPPVNFYFQAYPLENPVSPLTAPGATPRNNGLFLLPLRTIGTYTFGVTEMPINLYVKSVTFGEVDVLKDGFRVSGVSPETELKIVLTPTPPVAQSPGVRIRGRVIWPGNAAPLAVSFETRTPGAANQRPTVRIAESLVKQDGTYEFTGVPPGRYFVHIVMYRRRALPSTSLKAMWRMQKLWSARVFHQVRRAMLQSSIPIADG